QRVFHRRERQDHADRSRCAELFSEPRTSSPILCPAALRARAALSDPRCRRPHNQSPLRAPQTQGGQLGRPGRGRKSTRPGANGVVELSPFEFLDRVADLVPPPRKHRHRYHGVFAPNHKLRRAVTALAIGNIGKRSEAGHAGQAHATGCCDTQAKPRLHDTSRIASAKLLARVGEEFPVACPACGGDIRLIAFITEPGPIRKILTHLGEPLEPPPIAAARGPPTDWDELVQAHDDRDVFQASPDNLPVIDIHSL
ncbi:MAG: hypothetical protein FJ286_08205, partial [Planctomycetes bacterium]|nr:hypothetical protein [Planctomycetota bacterium]